MNSNSYRYFISFSLISGIIALGVFTYLNHQASEDIKVRVESVNLVVRQHDERIEDTSTRLDKTNQKLLVVRRKITSINEQLYTLNNRSESSEIWEKLKEQIGALYTKFDTMGSRIQEIEVLQKKLESAQRELKEVVENKIAEQSVAPLPKETEEPISIEPTVTPSPSASDEQSNSTTPESDNAPDILDDLGF